MSLKKSLPASGCQSRNVAAYLVGQVLAIHPAYEAGFAGFRPSGLRGTARTEWAASEVRIEASANLGLRNVPVLPGGFAWHLIYLWPQWPPGLIDEAFKELARRWRPLLDYARDRGCVPCFELHPGSDVSASASMAEISPGITGPAASGRLGDGQVDFKRIFTLLTEARFDGWAVLEWGCCVKSPE